MEHQVKWLILLLSVLMANTVSTSLFEDHALLRNTWLSNCRLTSSAQFWVGKLDLPYAGILYQDSMKIHYYLSTSQLHWIEAELSCRDSFEGGRMTLPRNEDQNQYVQRIIWNISTPYDGIWIHLNDVANEGVYVDADGDQIYSTASGQHKATNDAYTNFAINEPNNANNDESYGAMYKAHGLWNDIGNSQQLDMKRLYVCEVRELHIPTSCAWTSCNQKHKCGGHFMNVPTNSVVLQTACPMRCIETPGCLTINYDVITRDCIHVMNDGAANSTIDVGFCCAWSFESG